MSDPEERAPQNYGTIVIVGGGCYGSYYVRQLQRAAAAGALTADQLLVVDHDSRCLVARDLEVGAGREQLPLVVRIVASEWREFFADYLGRAAADPTSFARDAIVPSPLMPHLMGEWIVNRVRTRFSERSVVTAPFDRPPLVPWEKAGADGTHYVSFATWMCPVNCVEPRTCPHTRDTRTWSMPERLQEHARDSAAHGQPMVLATLFCRHRAYGVGMFDTVEVTDAYGRIEVAVEQGPAEVIIGTVSHCHGALTRLLIGEPAAAADSPVA